MFSTRLRSDDCKIGDESQINKGIFRWTTDKTQTMPANPHLAQFGQFSPVTRVMPVSQMVDFESSMLGLNTKLSKCPKSNIPSSCSRSTKKMYCDDMRQSYTLN